MIVDSSAVVAIVFAEPEAAEFVTLLTSAETPLISAATVLEIGIVVGRDRHSRLDDLLAAASVTVVPFDAEQSLVARDAYARYGRGSGSPARLNYGDCFSYALATVTGQPLLFKGDDFVHTDVEAAR